MNKKRSLGVSLVLGTLFSIALVIGSKIDDFNFDNPMESFSLGDYFFNIPVLAIVLAVVIYIIYFFLFNNTRTFKKETTRKRKKTLKRFLIFWLIIFVCWIPYFMAFYPGILSPDSNNLIDQSLGIIPINNRHPVLYTLIVSVFINLGVAIRSVNFGVALFSLFQMLVMSAVFAYSVVWVEKNTKSKWVKIAMLCFYALNPVIAMYSITMWKDVTFAGAMLIFILSITDVVISKGEIFSSTSKTIRFAIVALAVSFLRNNGIYVVIFTFIFIVLFYRKILKARMLILLATAIVFFVITGPIYNALGIAKAEFAETVGMPLQQISYSIKNGAELSEEQEEILSNILPIEKYAKNYIPYSPDYIKFDDEFNDEYLDSHKIEFVMTWIELFPANAKSYFKAWLMQTVGYYDVGSPNWLVTYDFVPDEELNIHNYDLIKEITGIHARNIIETQLIDSDFNKLPIYNIALSVYVLAIFFGLNIIRRSYQGILIGMPLFGLWGTLMVAAPTWSEFRYMYAFHLALPIILILLFYKPHEMENLTESKALVIDSRSGEGLNKISDSHQNI